jgi:tRNA-specific 2-thiouridylase
MVSGFGLLNYDKFRCMRFFLDERIKKIINGGAWLVVLSYPSVLAVLFLTTRCRGPAYLCGFINFIIHKKFRFERTDYMSTKGKVLVAMSGGIDSTVTALMLHHEGYEVVGITMKTWDYTSSGGSKKETGCCNLDSFNDARMAAVQHGFPHYILDIREEFGSFVVENFVDEYLAGRTPNPCVLCNTHIKWRALLKRADALGCDFIATGHYASVRQHENGRFVISKGVDETKDQSYVLWGLEQDLLSRTLLPLGTYRKTAIRQMAHDFGYPELAKKHESYEICFVPDNDYRGFLRRKVDGLEEKVAGGSFVNKEGKILGRHKGYPFYTIGQRKGLDITLGKPAYVTAIDPDTNTVVLGDEEDLEKEEMKVAKVNWIKYDGIPNAIEATTKIRYKDKGSHSIITPMGNDVSVRFFEKAKGIAPGQSAVFYDGEDVIGGGIIQRG